MKYTLKNRPVKGSAQSYERWCKGLEKELREPKVSDKIMNWLACNKNLPLKLKVEMIVGLYVKEILGEATT